LEDRFSGPVTTTGIFAGVAMVVDGTDCPIDKPSSSKEDRLLYFSGRSKDNQYSKYNVKYTIGVQIGTGKIVLVVGPTPGSVHDITALREGEKVLYIISHDPYELILGDKGYQVF